VLDPISFEIVDSLLLGPFVSAVSFDYLNRSFLMTRSSVKALRSSDLENMGYIIGSFTNIQAGLDGNLYCFTEAGVEWYDAEDLSLQGNFAFPVNTLGAAVLPGKEYLVYIYQWTGSGINHLLDIHDMRTGEILGTVEDVPDSMDWGVFLFPSKRGDFLWGFLGGNGVSSIDCFSIIL